MAAVPVKQLYGTAQTVINSAVDIAAGNFGGAPAATFDNTIDAAVPYAMFARVTASFPDWAAAPVAGTVIELWGVLIDTDGTSDDTDAPSGSAQNGARLFGQFVMAAVDALQRRSINISLMGVTKVDFYLRNGTAQNMNNDGGVSCIAKVTPYTLGTS